VIDDTPPFPIAELRYMLMLCLTTADREKSAIQRLSLFCKFLWNAREEDGIEDREINRIAKARKVT
jgi:hypothetical protein